MDTENYWINMTKKVVAKNDNGEIVEVFDTVNDAASYFGMKNPTLLYHKRRGHKINGLTVDYLDEHNTRIKKTKTIIPENYRFEEKEVELDREKYLIIKYEVKYGRVCITPCPFMDAPKHMVGSGKCITCSRNRGRKKSTHEIACAKKHDPI